MKVHQAFALHGDVPSGRVCAWNVVAVLVAAGALYVGHRLAILGVVLACIVGMVAVTGYAIARIGGERSLPALRDEVAEEHKRVAALMAARCSMREAA